MLQNAHNRLGSALPGIAGALLDAEAEKRVVDRGPGAALPLRLGLLVGLEGAVPLLGACGGLGEMRVLVGAAHDPEPSRRGGALLLDAETGMGVVHRGPGAALPLRLGLLVGGEGAGPLLRSAALHFREGRVGIDAA